MMTSFERNVPVMAVVAFQKGIRKGDLAVLIQESEESGCSGCRASYRSS